MAVVPADQLTFSLIVEQYYLSLRGRGLMVSPVEQEFIRSWEATGAPAWVVCQGIRAAFDSWERRASGRRGGPRSLAYCRKAVERALEGWRAARVGEHAGCDEDEDEDEERS